jgi:hypothetical protein
MLKIVAASCAALSLITSTAYAQTASAPDPHRLALARQIFEAQGGAENANKIVEGMMKSMVDGSETPEAKRRMTAGFQSMIKTFIPAMFDQMAGYYATDFTEDQLKDILAFYQSPTGNALRANGPILAQQIGGSIAQMMPKMQLSVLDKVCSETECTANQKQQLAALKQAIPADQRF